MISKRNDLILKELNPKFSGKIRVLLNNCYAKGQDFLLMEGVRNPFKQAVYWKRSRSNIEIDQQIDFLKRIEADFIAYCLYAVGDHTGSHITDALPGLSWHQYGLAVDFAWIVNSQICWDNQNQIGGFNGYEVLASEATRLGLCSGHYWEKFQDSGHIQSDSRMSPLENFSWKDINNRMQKKYSYLLKTH